ncbi:hypothetical protein K1719_024248 [Acacia pycnantha]|nr:hypothetical protein K1719_024248 [Acacia pycnantha]
MVFGKKRPIIYEGLHQVCLECGKYGHIKKECPSLQVEKSEKADDKQAGDSNSGDGGDKNLEKEMQAVDAGSTPAKAMRVLGLVATVEPPAMKVIFDKAEGEPATPQHTPRFLMNYMIWNSRAPGARSFPALVRDLKSHYKLDFIAILETRCSKASTGRANQAGFTHMELIDNEGYSGGIWCPWEPCISHVVVIERHHQFMHLRITDASSHYWMLTVVYASPSIVGRRTLWSNLSLDCTYDP